MSKQLVEMIEAVAYEKSMPRDLVRAAMEAAIAALARRESKAPEGLFRAHIDDDGLVEAWRYWNVVEGVVDTEKEHLADDTAAVGDVVEQQVDTPQWTRQGLQVVKQVLAQKLKQGLRSTIAEAWGNRVGDVVMGVVKRVDKKRIVLDLGEPVEGVLAGRDCIPGEVLRVGNRCRALVTHVAAEGQGPVITLSRSADDFVRELVAIEVPEVDLGQVIVKNVARDAGARAKIAVQAGIGLRNHPAAVCVGMRGVRAQAVSNEINGERLEFIQWSEDPAEFLIAALAPAEVATLVIDENERKATVGVAKDNLARAIGAKGQNVRLAAKLTGWSIDLMSVEDLQAKREEEDAEATIGLMELLNIDADVAEVLVREGFNSVEDIHYSSIGDLLVVEELDEDIAEELKQRAADAVLLKEMLAVRLEEEETSGIAELGDLPNITSDDVAILNAQGIHSVQDLADQGTMDVEWDEERDDELNAWIMAARKAVGMI